jgi:uncharacterized protein (TIGR03437 family)
MAGVDGHDPATVSSEGVALSDYTPYLKADGLDGARIGVATQYWSGTQQLAILQGVIQVMESLGATVINVDIGSYTQLNASSSSVLKYEFKRDLNTYLATRGPSSPIQSLADVIAYNNAHQDVALKYGQSVAMASQAVDLYADEPKYIADRANDLQLAKVQGIDATMDANNLTALLFQGANGADIAAKAGYPSISVPAGYLSSGQPFGIAFTGKAYSEPTLIALAYAFEQATKVRQPPGSALRLVPVSSQIQPSQVASYATGAPGPVAPGEMIVISGSGLGPSPAASSNVTANGHIDTVAGGSRVLFDGIPAPMISAQAGQIVAIVPYAMAGRSTAKMTVEYGGQTSSAMTVQITDVAPGILTDQPLGKGMIVVQNDGAPNSASNPAKKGSYVTFFVTGEGIPSTLGIDGLLAVAPSQTPLQKVSVTIGGLEAPVFYAGAAPGTAGVMQVNAQLDPNVPSGTVPLVVQVGSKAANPATMNVQ